MLSRLGEAIQNAEAQSAQQQQARPTFRPNGNYQPNTNNNAWKWAYRPYNSQWSFNPNTGTWGFNQTGGWGWGWGD
ncbi:MAG: hypothetical protein QM775_19685 [Pirellulales bacterium]